MLGIFNQRKSHTSVGDTHLVAIAATSLARMYSWKGQSQLSGTAHKLISLLLPGAITDHPTLLKVSSCFFSKAS